MDSTTADRHLAQDPQLAPLVRQITLAPLPAERTDLYGNLIRTIIFQQLSGRAAHTIYHRFLALFPAAYPHPGLLLDRSIEELRSAGISRRKASYLHHVAEYWQQEHLAQVTDWAAYDDADLVRKLTSIRGVGPWTVEMLLIFTLGRPDVLPIEDLAIRTAIQELYGLTTTGKALRREIGVVTAPWQPYRSRACRYLWAWKDIK
jgi:DNA-3-methyladenine glycosylase II